MTLVQTENRYLESIMLSSIIQHEPRKGNSNNKCPSGQEKRDGRSGETSETGLEARSQKAEDRRQKTEDRTDNLTLAPCALRLEPSAV